MSDPLSVTGSVVGIISLGLQVTQSLYNYYTAINAQYSDVTHTARKLKDLLEILNCLQTHLSGRVKVDGTHVLKNIESNIRQCEEYIQELQEESRKFEREPVDGIRTAIRATGRRLAYPFRESTLKKLDEDIDELVIHLSLALQLLQQDVTDRMQDEIEDTRAVLNLVRASQLSSEIRNWLKAPDASIDFNDACNKKNPGTESKKYARQMLAILCCAVRPLTVPELIDAMAVEVGAATASFDAKRKLEGIDDFQQLCPGFTEIGWGRYSKIANLHIAHFSVQEYLESEGIHTQKEASFFGVQRREGNGLMAIICLTLLLEPQVSIMKPSLVRCQYPLADYAAEQWPRHYRECVQEGLAETQVIRLFLEEPAFQAWVSIYFAAYLWGRNVATPSPLYHASKLGLYSTLRAHLEDKSLSYSLDTAGGELGTAIETAAYNGHQHIVQLLLGYGVDPNRVDRDGCALIHKASDRGYTGVVKLLLKNGANVNLACQFGCTPIYMASERGHTEVVKLLLEDGADAAIVGLCGCTPIYEASVRGHNEVVKLLLKNRADLNLIGRHGWTLIYMASTRDDTEMVKLLLKNGAVVNIRGRPRWWLLITIVSARGFGEMAKLLLENSADGAIEDQDG
ncbi:uncharacterized protein GLRG_02473 [Colletotrichum graminicola M1.001]|uniref:Uncharacterized protein n=1 Tax=Colletotrichum graminicola (strain M1.001 / M2 / FGSC 10212) TaxID=645133 RepID=E3Q715_COLGM|nr:uncharacterized protein GLRG_02473 [Colletotrichum graminicola M1.001]EFQ26653.1 hypothetical protein GLRG_02473 [Colletotrichum graminicola M1.001]